MSTEIKKVGDNHYRVKGMPDGMKEEVDLHDERMSNLACRKPAKSQTEEEKKQCRVTAKEKAVKRKNDMMSASYAEDYQEKKEKADQEYENG